MGIHKLCIEIEKNKEVELKRTFYLEIWKKIKSEGVSGAKKQSGISVVVM